MNQTIGAGESADAVADRIAGNSCAVSGLDDAAFRKLFTQMKTGDRQVAQGIADDKPTHVVLAAFAIEHQLREATTRRRFTIRHFIDTCNASDGPIHPPRHITHPPRPPEALYYVAAAVLVALSRPGSPSATAHWSSTSRSQSWRTRGRIRQISMNLYRKAHRDSSANDSMT